MRFTISVQFNTKMVQLITIYFLRRKIHHTFGVSIIKKRTIMINLSKTLFGILLKVLIALIWVGTLEETQAQKSSTSVNVNSNNGKTTITVKNGRSNSFSLEFEGDITLSDDDQDIVAISRGGFMEIKKSAFGSRRRIFIEPDNSGQLIKKYYVGSSEENFNSGGKKWLAEILPEVLRSSALGAEQRVNRFYGKGGTYAVLKEVEQIDSDYVKSAYIKLLLDKNPKSDDLVSVLNVVGEDIHSDHHRAEILKRNAKAFLNTEAATNAYIKTAGKINSDHHKANVLKKSIQDGGITDTQMNALFGIAKSINSDHHKADVLLTILKDRTLNSTNINLLIATSRNINSDHHKANVLKAALAAQGLSKSSHNALLESMGNINSDHHSASIFNDLLNQEMDSGALAQLLQLADRNMSSDHHKGTVLRKVVKNQSLKDGNLEVLLSAIKRMGSDNHQAEIFKQLAKKSFSSDQLINILMATKSMSSDYHQAESLLAFASATSEKGNATKEAYRDACGSISSESHYGKAIRAIQ